MRKTTVVFSDKQWEQLCDIARREHRFPKQQIELWVYQALSQADAARPTPPPAKARAPQTASAPEGGRA